MLKRTIYFSQPYHLSIKLSQLVCQNKTTGEIKQVPIEDLGFVLLENKEITFTQSVISELNDNNVATIFCNNKHLPTGMVLNLDGNDVQNEKFRAQVAATEPLKKRLWQQTIKAKVLNQAKMLEIKVGEFADLKHLATKVLSGDTSGIEAQAARRYWPKLFGPIFKRERFGEPPNPSLNYGYTILRAAVARALVGSGLLPTLGIQHHNRYNAYCLADDIMEPYRPFVDFAVWQQKQIDDQYHVFTTERKMKLLKVLSRDVIIGKLKRPLMNALSITTASLAKCFEGKAKKITYPKFP